MSHQLVGGKRLFHVIGRAAVESTHDVLALVVRRHEDHRDIRPLPAKPGQQVEQVRTAHLDIEQQQLRTPRLDHIVEPDGRRLIVHVKTGFLHGCLPQLADQKIILDIYNPWFHRLWVCLCEDSFLSFYIQICFYGL